MKDLNIVIVGGAMGFGALIAEMAVEAGAKGIGIIDLADAAEVLAPLAAKGVKTAAAKADIRTAAACPAAMLAGAARTRDSGADMHALPEPGGACKYSTGRILGGPAKNVREVGHGPVRASSAAAATSRQPITSMPRRV